MKKMILSLMTVVITVASFAQDATQLRRERIQAAYMLAFGRAPQDGEISYWQGRNESNSIADLLRSHKTYIGQDVTTRTAAIRRAYIDAIGRNPSADEIKYWSAYNQTYTELMKNHVQWLSSNPSEYEKVIKNSYQFVLNRQPSSAEITYWKGQGVLSYAMLVGCHEDWKKKNPPSAQKTSGKTEISSSSGYLSVVALSAGIAAEARIATGLTSSPGSNMVAAGGGNMVAAGGGNMVAAGGGNMVAAGGGN
ncbi:hypothetical protein GWC95_19000 [Sediminibacterium roseum]|uniref:DUF4214 domain-containing protein n=1 Tax=Sediminibacterium roseum TaxID=1978412 RepID=A0ABW9ZZP2_9BACT|nr:hypothetical protein [Sediminibacterium roseum]NCI52020.1 hypothetical protein [Sediminibacterium roseum]